VVLEFAINKIWCRKSWKVNTIQQAFPSTDSLFIMLVVSTPLV